MSALFTLKKAWVACCFVSLLILLAFFGIAPSALAQPSPWQSFPESRLLDLPGDGDSFSVEILREGKPEQILVRLYFADAPESDEGVDADRRRIVEQMRYFGVASPQTVIESGRQATTRTRELLARPFTLHTAFANAPGRSRTPRTFAAITTADGQDLASQLVREGLARAHGVSRSMPDGTSGAEFAARIADLEAAAMLAGVGIWKESDPNLLATGRAEGREEENRLRNLFRPASDEPIHINSATIWELQSLPGVGETLAKRIIEHRPFASIEDLAKVRGISKASAESWKDRISFDPPQSR